MEEKNLEKIDLEANPRRIVLINKDDTKERLKKLEEKLEKNKRLSNRLLIGNSISCVLGIGGFFTSVSGVMHSDKALVVGLVGSISLAVASGVGLTVEAIIEKRAKKMESELERIRKAVKAREKAQNNPNIVIEEKTEKETLWERKLEKKRSEKIGKVGAITSTSVGSLGGLGGYAVGGLFGAGIVGGVSAGLTYLPFALARHIAKVRESKIEKQLEESMNQNHPDYCAQELLREIAELSKQTKQKLESEAEKTAFIDQAYTVAKSSDDKEVLQRLLNIAKKTSQESGELIKQFAVDTNQGRV